MPFQVARFSCFDRDFKHLPEIHKAATRDALKEIQRDPKQGKPLSGNMKGLNNYSYNRKPELRIIYSLYECKKSDSSGKHFCEHKFHNDEIEDCHGLVDFIFVKTREEANNLYAYNKKFFDSYKR